jgi:hypothetical protein
MTRSGPGVFLDDTCETISWPPTEYRMPHLM